MSWTKHSDWRGKHAIFSPSQPYWLKYDSEGIKKKCAVHYATEIGTAVHDLASWLIDERQRISEDDHLLVFKALRDVGIPRSVINTENILHNLVPYVSDAVMYEMETEVPLVYSKFIFGTADAVSFKRKLLRIHDLKTGVGAPHREQLETYAALFCFENNQKPETLKYELRLYQNGEQDIWKPDPLTIRSIYDRIIIASEDAASYFYGKG